MNTSAQTADIYLNPSYFLFDFTPNIVYITVNNQPKTYEIQSYQIILKFYLRLKYNY